MIKKDDFIVKDGVKYYYNTDLERPQREDFFVATDETEFGGMIVPIGHFNDSAFERAKKENSENFSKECPNKSGYYCKNLKCSFPKCVNDQKTN